MGGVKTMQAYRFALDPTPAQARKLRSHAGAARFAFNWGLALVKTRLDEHAAGEDVDLPWRLTPLRYEWNRAKHEIAPWWAENSKEAYSAGLDALAQALGAWSDSRNGKRKGQRVGFPRFRRRGTSHESFRVTTGRFGVSSRTSIQLPRIGHLRSHEPTSKLRRKLADGSARILSATITREGSRWFCSFTCEVERGAAVATYPDATVGVDAGLRHLAVLSTGEFVANPRALERAQRKLRRLQRKVDRQRRIANPDCYDERGRARTGKRPRRSSRRQRDTEQRIARLYVRTANLRRDAISKLTTSLASNYGTVVCEHLNVAGMVRNHHLARSVHDAALAEIRRQLRYKCAWRGGNLIEAPRFYPSSKTCSGCGVAKAKLLLSERTYRCDNCGLVIDRDLNAARNLAALTTDVAASGAETENVRSPTEVRPSQFGHTVDRKAGIASASETGIAYEQSEAARSAGVTERGR